MTWKFRAEFDISRTRAHFHLGKVEKIAVQVNYHIFTYQIQCSITRSYIFFFSK